MNRFTRGKERAALAATFALAASMLGDDCAGDVTQDPTFRDWCGPSLCAWTLDTGRIEPAPTWNANDLGVSFVETPTAITQVTPESSAKCLLFTSVADIDPQAQMTIAVDFNADGSVEYTAPIASASWERVQTEITTPIAYQGIAFTLRKDGQGTAILAEMRIQSTTGCTAPAPVIDAGSLKLGEKCATSADCAGGLTCVTSMPGSDDTLCGQCSPSQACAGGAACSARSVFLPTQCAPGAGRGKPGDPCLAGSDCASGACDGAVAVPLAPGDAGSCDLAQPIGDANPSNCPWYGARGGACR
jgi:hypothetical protein